MTFSAEEIRDHVADFCSIWEFMLLKNEDMLSASDFGSVNANVNISLRNFAGKRPSGEFFKPLLLAVWGCVDTCSPRAVLG